MATALERQISIGIGPRPQRSGNEALIDTLRRWGVTFFAGVNGGGLIHVNKYLEPFDGLEQSCDGGPRMLTMGEYVAGFVPQGHWYATGRVAGCVTTTGAATKLGSSGITDAKLQNIPAVYLIALNSTSSIGKAPLQDVSEDGANIVPQLQAELGDGCVVIDNIHTLDESLRRARRGRGPGGASRGRPDQARDPLRERRGRDLARRPAPRRAARARAAGRDRVDREWRERRRGRPSLRVRPRLVRRQRPGVGALGRGRPGRRRHRARLRPRRVRAEPPAHRGRLALALQRSRGAMGPPERRVPAPGPRRVPPRSRRHRPRARGDPAAPRGDGPGRSPRAHLARRPAHA